ncbi:sigma 54-interacting transcriptional regulator [Verticiella sediminum]|nr:sigma 54-interacting transcriptional regulator [Verticiella sediminum]
MTRPDSTPALAAWPLRAAPGQPLPGNARIFEDERSRALLDTMRRIGPTDAGILIVGDTGSDKETVARHLHDLSRRRDGPFVSVNCGALSEPMVDAELFGYEHGAFTGAFGGQPGWLEEAHEGTLFLDELEALPLAVQTRLVRAMLDKSVARLGGRTRRRVDVRVLAAATPELEQRVASGAFRKDLYYQVSVVRLSVAPLAERPGDILPLARHFIATYCQRLGHARAELTPAAQSALREHAWPGDVRELENAIHRSLLLAQGRRIDVAALALQPAPAAPMPEAGHGGSDLERALHALCRSEAEGLEQQVLDHLLLAAWRHNRCNQVQTARQLGISRSVVRARLHRLGQLAPPAGTGAAAPPTETTS